MRGDKWTKNAQTSKHGAGYVDILFELRLLLSGHKMYKSVDNQSVGNTINNSISRPSDERTVPLCGPTRPGASSPPRYIYLSGSDDAIEQWTGGRGDGIAGGSEEQRERIDRASRSGGAALHGGFQPTPSWARMKHYNYGFQVKR